MVTAFPVAPSIMASACSSAFEAHRGGCVPRAGRLGRRNRPTVGAPRAAGLRAITFGRKFRRRCPCGRRGRARRRYLRPAAEWQPAAVSRVRRPAAGSKLTPPGCAFHLHTDRVVPAGGAPPVQAMRRRRLPISDLRLTSGTAREPFFNRQSRPARGPISSRQSATAGLPDGGGMTELGH